MTDSRAAGQVLRLVAAGLGHVRAAAAAAADLLGDVIGEVAGAQALDRKPQPDREHEIERQTRAYEDDGRTIENTPRSTRGWDDDREVTVHQRAKESEDDYRYFPEPDLPPVRIPTQVVDAERAALPELPRARRARYVETLGLSAYDAGVLAADREVADWFEAVLADGNREPKAAANWVTGEVMRHLNETSEAIGDVALAPDGLGELLDLLAAGTINTPTARDLFREVVASGESPRALVEERGLAQVSDPGAIEAAAKAAIEAHPQAAEDVRGGNAKAIGRLIGEAMKALGGRGDPKQVQQALRDLLS